MRSAFSSLAPESLADQIAGSKGDQQRSGGMLLHLLLDTFFQLVDIGIAQPVGARLHSAGEGICDGGDSRVIADGHRRSGDLCGCSTLTQSLGACLQSVGEHCRKSGRLVLDGRSHAPNAATYSTAAPSAVRAFRSFGVWDAFAVI